MIKKINWAARIVAYLACFIGIFLYLRHPADLDPAGRNPGLAFLGAGFVAFFVSYALQAWQRFGPPPRSTGKEQP